MVVSVGPYMFSMRAEVADPRSSTSDRGNASPPSNRVLTLASAARLSSFMAIMRAIDGVHCRCVTLWRINWAAIE